MLTVFDGKGHPRADTAAHYVPGSGCSQHGPHRRRGAVPGILGRLATHRHEGFNDWGGRGYDDFVPGEVTKTAPSGDETT